VRALAGGTTTSLLLYVLVLRARHSKYEVRKPQRKSCMKTLLLLLLFSPWLLAQGSRPAISLTDAEGIEAGEVVARDFIRREGMEPTPQTKKIDAYLQVVGERIAAHGQRILPYRFRYDPSPGFKSAVGLPGGLVVVGAGMLAYLDTEDQLAMVLGHEIEHIALNQCHDRLVKLMMDEHLTSIRSQQINGRSVS